MNLKNLKIKIMKFISTSFKAFRKVIQLLNSFFYLPFSRVMFALNGASIAPGLKVLGFIKVYVTRRGRFTAADNLHLNSGDNHNIIGRQQKCIFWVEGELIIGRDVGISGTAIICTHKIVIGNNVKIGGNCVIYDTDFHSLNKKFRSDIAMDRLNTKWAPVVIEDNVFLGAHSTVLKGAHIGDGAVIGSCSVVTGLIPSNEVWAGNPIRFIRKL